MNDKSLEEKYLKQLKYICNSTNCMNIFCKIKEEDQFIEFLKKRLNNYGNIFLCNNNELKDINKYQSDIYLEIVLYFLYGKETHNLCGKNWKKNLKKNEKKLINLILNKILKRKEEINYCYLFIKIFILFNNNIEIEDDNLINFVNLFIGLKTIVLEIPRCKEINFKCNLITSKIEIEDKFIQKNKKTISCLFSKNLTKFEFGNLIEIFKRKITKLSDNKILTSNELLSYLNIFMLLYELNEEYKIFPYYKFYLTEFCIKMDFETERFNKKNESFSILNYSFILPLNLKSKEIKMDNLDTMKRKLKDAFFKALFNGEVPPYLQFSINRHNFYNDAKTILDKLNPECLKKQLKVSFINEEGIDSGGITKEFFQLLSERIVHDHNLFTFKNDFIWFKTIEKGLILCKSKEDLLNNDDFFYDVSNIKRSEKEIINEYISIGKLIGIGFFNSVVLNIPFPTLFFKKLLNLKDFELEDIKFIEPEIYNSLKKLKNFSEEEFEVIDQTFSITYDTNGNCYSKELKENGSNIKVKKETVNEFIQLYINWIVNLSINEPFNALKKGFFSVINFNSIKYLKPQEMEKIIVGSQFIDLKFLKKHVIYSDFNENDLIICQFWEVLASYNEKTLKKFVQFVTGNDRVPVIGLDKWKITILKNGCDTERLPSSQTCFNSLLLPEYSSKEKLAKKLNTAIMFTKGFFLM